MPSTVITAVTPFVSISHPKLTTSEKSRGLVERTQHSHKSCLSRPVWILPNRLSGPRNCVIWKHRAKMWTSKSTNQSPPSSSSKTTTASNRKRKPTIWRSVSLTPTLCACATSPSSARNRSGCLPWSNQRLHRTWLSSTGMIPCSLLLIWIQLTKESTISWLRNTASSLLKSKNRPSTWLMPALKSQRSSS